MTKHPLPARVPPPGQRLKDELEKRLWTQDDVARIMGRPTQLISGIISGKRQITPTTALELAEVFGTSPKFWATLESDYQLYLARESHSGDEIAKRSELFELLPIREMIKRNWLSLNNPKDFGELEEQVLAFADVSTIDEMPQLAANFHMSYVAERTPETRGHYAWQLQVKNLARQQHVGRFEHEKLDEVIDELLALSVTPNGVRKVPQTLKRAGIRFVIVPHFSKTYLDGAAFHIDGDPVVALTLRYDRVDNFWFVLLHELSHIYLGHPDVLFDEVMRKGDRPSKGIEEEEADSHARTFLINPHSYQDFVEETFMDLDEDKIREFAKGIRRHPGIVVGRLHWDGVLHFSEGRHLLERVSPYLKEVVDKP